jgi:hypothetical protein
MIVSVHQPQYLPWLGYFHKIAKSDCFVFLDEVQYKVREYQNRNRIRIKDGDIWLTVPIISKGKGRQNICEVEIDNDFPWAKRHLKSLKDWYARAGFLSGHIGFFEEVYSRKWDKLVDLNIYIIDYLLTQFGITPPVYSESKLGTTKMSTERIIEICDKLKADTYLSGIGGKDYLEQKKFDEAGIKLIYQDFTHPVYRQQFMADKSDFLRLTCCSTKGRGAEKYLG